MVRKGLKRQNEVADGFKQLSLKRSRSFDLEKCNQAFYDFVCDSGVPLSFFTTDAWSKFSETLWMKSTNNAEDLKKLSVSPGMFYKSTVIKEFSATIKRKCKQAAAEKLDKFAIQAEKLAKNGSLSLLVDHHQLGGVKRRETTRDVLAVMLLVTKSDMSKETALIYYESVPSKSNITTWNLIEPHLQKVGLAKGMVNFFFTLV